MVTPESEYITQALSEPVPIVVDESSKSSSRAIIPVVVWVFTIPSLNVHQSFIPTSHNLNGTELLAHIVAVLGITTLSAAVIARYVQSPVPAVTFLKPIYIGSVALGSVPALVFNAIVSAHAALSAVIVRLYSVLDSQK